LEARARSRSWRPGYRCSRSTRAVSEDEGQASRRRSGRIVETARCGTSGRTHFLQQQCSACRRKAGDHHWRSAKTTLGASNLNKLNECHPERRARVFFRLASGASRGRGVEGPAFPLVIPSEAPVRFFPTRAFCGSRAPSRRISWLLCTAPHPSPPPAGNSRSGSQQRNRSRLGYGRGRLGLRCGWNVLRVTRHKHSWRRRHTTGLLSSATARWHKERSNRRRATTRARRTHSRNWKRRNRPRKFRNQERQRRIGKLWEFRRWHACSIQRLWRRLMRGMWRSRHQRNAIRAARACQIYAVA